MRGEEWRSYPLTAFIMETLAEHRRLSNVLEDTIEQAPCSLKAWVAQVIASHNDPESYLGDILRHGCICGCVGELIYYRDTHAFFDRFYDEIEDLREDWEFQTGAPLDIKGDLKNYLAWFAFETCAWEIADEAGLEW